MYTTKIRDTLNHNESVPIWIIIIPEPKTNIMDNNMEGLFISYLIQRGAGEDISSDEGWLQALGIWAFKKKKEAQSRGKMVSRKLGSNSFDFQFLDCLWVSMSLSNYMLLSIK